MSGPSLQRRAGPAFDLLRRTPRLGPLVPLETLGDAIAAAADEAAAGVGCSLAYLAAPGDEEEDAVRPYAAAAGAVAAAGLGGELSVKLSMLSGGADWARREERLHRVSAEAVARGVGVWVDMEGPDAVAATLALVRRVRREHPGVGVTVQAYLRRTADDVEALIADGAPVRLVKGSFRPGAAMAFRSRRAIADHYLRLGARLLAPDARGAGVRAAFATHDLALLERLRDHAWSLGLDRRAFEWHALRGVRTARQRRVAREGWPVRAVISYGEGWLRWYAGRLLARPSAVWRLAGGLAR